MGLDDILVPQVTDISAEQGSPDYITGLDQQLVRLFELKRAIGFKIEHVFQDGFQAALALIRDSPGITCVGTVSGHIVDSVTGATYQVSQYPVVHVDSSSAKRRLQVQLGWITAPRRVEAQRLQEKINEIDRSGEFHVQTLQSYTTIERVHGTPRHRHCFIYYVGGDGEIYLGSLDLLCGLTRTPAKTDFTLETLELKLKEPAPKNISVIVVKNPSKFLLPELYLAYEHLRAFEEAYFGKNLFKRVLSGVLKGVKYDPDVRTLRTLNYGFVHGLISGFDLPGTVIGNDLYRRGKPSLYFGSLADRRVLPGLTPDEYASVRYLLAKSAGDALGLVFYVGSMVGISPLIPLIPLSLGYLNTRRLQRKLTEDEGIKGES
ncbi:hypothetical protein HYY69_02020 [Candidatus Woesearchaeota archaeon]|nr:hypothetical protein [Candidatus Woesearchaeota archaeon]